MSYLPLQLSYAVRGLQHEMRYKLPEEWVFETEQWNQSETQDSNVAFQNSNVALVKFIIEKGIS